MGETNRTKQAMGQALMELCQTESFNKLTVQKITQQVGVNRQTFYYHFTDKEELLRWVYLQGSLLYLTSAQLNLTNWEEQALLMLKHVQQHGAFYTNTVEANQDIFTQEFTRITRQLFTDLFNEIDEEMVLSTTDKDFYARFFAYGCSGVLLNWITEGYQESPLEIATQLFRLAKDVEFFAHRLYEKEEE